MRPLLAQTADLLRRHTYPPAPDGLPTTVLEQGRYRLSFATTGEELDAVLRLRFRVFNLEMGEGLDSSFVSGRDEDSFDACCHHLLVENTDTREIVGTYRIQTRPMAEGGNGFYSAGEFDLRDLPEHVIHDAAETGRACIAREDRNRQVLFLLWRGLALYMKTNRKRFLFGCCSLNSQDPVLGIQLYRQLQAEERVDPKIDVQPLPGLECSADTAATVRTAPIPLPTLFRTYLRYGATVCSRPAIDRAFKTIDYFVVFDVEKLDRRSYQVFFGQL